MEPKQSQKGKKRGKMAFYGMPLIFGVFLFSPFHPAKAAILFQNDEFATVESSNLVINSDDESSGDLIIQFGQTLGETLMWNSVSSRFEFSDDLDLTGNQLTTFRVENAAAMPGGAGGLGAGGIGRVVELTATDSVAPGCTGPSCS
ncbi:MAG TPA: hypothetical protein VI588_02390, partial [Candidatus Gracilibacteria bacterium]|nr:hypothetical protein [Candidatus Gracilibacteria bacterium]